MAAMNRLVTVAVVSCLVSYTSGRYSLWPRDEDTIQTRFRDAQIGTSLNDVLNNHHNEDDNHRERHHHQNDDSSNTDTDNSANHDLTTHSVVEHKNKDGNIQCGGSICFESGSYCCLRSDGNYHCCLSRYLYQLWWFWMIWLVLFFLILACSLVCWRRSRQQYRYVVMANSEYPNYGTSVHVSSTQTAHSAPAGYPYTTAPVSPPGYSAAEKPPAYSS